MFKNVVLNFNMIPNKFINGDQIKMIKRNICLFLLFETVMHFYVIKNYVYVNKLK